MAVIGYSSSRLGVRCPPNPMLTPKASLVAETQQRHPHVYEETASYFEGELSADEFKQILDQLSDTSSLIGDGRSCVVFGYGSQSISTYGRLEKLDGANVVWQGNCGPWWMRPLSLVAAMRAGLVDVSEGPAVRPVLDALAHQAMVELHSFSTELNEAVRSHVYQHKWQSEIGELVGRDPGYFCFGVDGDNFDVRSGIFGWCSFGKQCPADLKSAVLTGQTIPLTGI